MTPQDAGYPHPIARGVVIVDDNALHIRVLDVVFLEHGIEVVGSALNGEDGVDVVGQTQPRLVVMDLMMPGIDGMEATRRIKERWPDIDVVAYTSIADPAVAFRFRAAGASAIFEKGEHYALAGYVADRLRDGNGDG